jgi:hypothetical protein
MTDFVKVSPQQEFGGRFEFTIQETSGSEIILATDSLTERSAWTTALCIFMKMEDNTPYRSQFHVTPNDCHSARTEDALPNKIESSVLTANQLDQKQDALLKEMSEMRDLLSKCMLQKDDSARDMLEALNAKICVQEVVLREIHGKVETRLETSGTHNYSSDPEKPAHFLLGSMNEKLVKSASSMDYISERLGKSLHRNQDMIRNQERLHQSLEQQKEEISELKRCFEQERQENFAKLNEILALLTKLDRRSASAVLTPAQHPTLEKIGALRLNRSTDTLCTDSPTS